MLNRLRLRMINCQQQQQQQPQPQPQQQQQQPKLIPSDSYIISEVTTITILIVAGTQLLAQVAETNANLSCVSTGVRAERAGGILGRRLKRLRKQMERRNGAIHVAPDFFKPLEQYMKAKVLDELYGFSH